MFLKPRQLVCAACGKRINEGDRIVVVEFGTVKRIGGLGMFRDELTIQDKVITRQHEKCE